MRYGECIRKFRREYFRKVRRRFWCLSASTYLQPRTSWHCRVYFSLQWERIQLKSLQDGSVPPRMADSWRKCKIMRIVRYGSGIFSFGSRAPFVAMLGLVSQTYYLEGLRRRLNIKTTDLHYIKTTLDQHLGFVWSACIGAAIQRVFQHWLDLSCFQG